MNSTAVSLVSRSSASSLRSLKTLGHARTSAQPGALTATRNASSWHYNQRNSTTFGGATWQSHYAQYHGGNPQRQHILIDPYPMTMDSGMLKVWIAVIASIYIGGKIAQKAATFLEENEIFVHTDDDDDD